MALRYARWTLAAAVLAWAGVACSSSEGPSGPATPPDSTATLAALAASDSAFTSPVYSSFSAALGGISFAAVSPISRAAPYLERWRLIAAAPRLLSLSGARGRGVAQVIRPAGSTTAADAVLPDSVLGKTFEWDTATNTYVKTTRAGAPANGVRFLLYALDNDTVAEPVTQVGQFDVIDLSTSSVPSVRLVVGGPGGTPTYYDATFRDQHSGGTDSSFTFSGSGFASNGGAGDALRRLAFNASLGQDLFADTAAVLTIKVSFTLSQPSVSFTSSLTEGENPTDSTTAYDLQLTSAAGSIRVMVSQVDNANGRLISGTFYSNGAVFTRVVQGGTGNPIWTDADGNLLSADNTAVAQSVVTLLIEGIGLYSVFLEPGAAFIGA
ncbi:MAG TPA: hypothetical protein VFK78_02290 [Gemmatimonadales bacterium]|nr:hypothetical protein [Gemmatimonadales bacterium]